jgi:hypothetical protein
MFWIVLALAVILLLAVGADYNLLLISHHYRPWPALRYRDRAVVYDTVYRSASRRLVLVAAEFAAPARQPNPAALRIPQHLSCPARKFTIGGRRPIDQRPGVVLGLTSGRWSVTTGLW